MSGRMAAWLLAPAMLVLVVLLGAPIAYLLSFSVLGARDGPEPGSNGFTLMNYAKLASDPFYVRIVGKTLWVSALSTAIAATIGYVLAHFMWRAPKRWRGLLTVLVMSPLLVSIVVSSYGWVVILGSQGVVNEALMQAGVITKPLKLMFTDGAIVVGLVHVAIPFMTLSILAVLERIDGALAEAATMLGANPWRVVWHVILPLALPGVGAGATIVFCLCLSSYVTPAVLGGSGPNFITTLIYNQFVTLFDWPFGAALAALLLALCLAIVLLSVWGLARLSTAAIGRA
jgi:putative spermidine/putrescine transport system permease protein